ncbi:protein mono-ADP-ribosyltransferase PARP14-like isoform X2 [Neoarius graeffei]|uniref:protein mono-ADP-ribosyltransferase PARP14-like isoform X2 n=1 Tax=Neoarius graeffei TaxID=443677 RepID=UPI00298C5384|nr:protein mono-ADP-ribosyltransferase PARP14-like isoform X2 [Neoarius graeffei]
MEDYPYPLLVEGDWSSINAKTLQSKVHIYFQSRKKSQGGDCVIRWSETSCTVFFKSQEIRDQVLSQAEHTVPIEKQVLKLKVSKPDSESHSKEKSQESAKTGSDVSAGALQPVPAVRTACSVLVENVPDDVITNKQLLELYFDKWGGPVEDISTNPEEQTIIVKFRSQDAAKRILEKTDHRLSSQPVIMCPYFGHNANQTEASEGLEDTPRSSAVVLENVPENLNQEYLMLLVDSIISHSEDEYSLELIPESNTVVVTFNDPRAVQMFLTECRNKRKFQEHGLKARHLEKSRTVKVENLPEQCPEEFLELYFEKHVGAVERIKAVADEKAAIVTFHDQQAVQKVLGTEHFIRKTPVDIYPYYTSLGSALYGKDRPTWTLPKPFTYKIHPAIREFLQKRGQLSSISDQMSSHFCQVNMDKDEVMFSPLPTLLRQKGITKKHIDSWKQDTIDALKNILSNFGVFEYTVNPSVLTAREKDIRSVVKDKAVLKVDLSTGSLTLAGMAKDINVLKPILENDLKKASSQMERDMNKTSETINMSSAKYLLLQQEGLQHSASAKYPELELTYKKDTNQLRFSGLLLEIMDIKNLILEKQLSMKEKALKMDPLLVEFLRSVDSEELSKDLFTSKGISAVYTFENGNIILTASTAKALTDAEKRLEMMLTLQNLSVEDLGVLGRPDWQDLTNQLYETYNSSRKKTVLIKSSNNRDTIVVYGFQDPVREVTKSLEQFIDTHSMTDEIIRARSYAMVKYIRERMPHVWQKFLKGDELNINYDPKRPLIRVSGERIHVQPVLKSFQNIIRNLHTDKLTIRKAGAKKFFQEQSGMFSMMMKEQRFVFVLEDASMEEEDEERYNEERYGEGRVEDFGQLSCEVQTPGGIVIKVLKADICQFKVDAVVNAANEDLKHIGGLALALLNAAGPSLQQISDQYVAAHGKLQPGNAVTTKAGHLPCRYVVHAVGPRYYNTDRSTSVKKLRQAVRESLNQAVLHRCSSIAVPAISSGIFGFPLDLCTETIAQELHAYIEDQNRQAGINMLKEIYLVDNNPKTVKAMAQAVKKEFAQFSPRMQMGRGRGHHGQNYHGHGNQSHGYHGQGAGRRQGFGEWENDAQVYRAKDSEDYKIQTHRTQFEDVDRSVSGFLETQSTKEGLKIILRKGNIQDARSDVIVNTISEDLDLSKGAVSRALLNTAGPQLQAEIRSTMREVGTSRLNPGDLVPTNGYNLHCQKVFQTVCPFWNGGTRSEDEILKGLIQNCLKIAENKKMTSITFPAIGSGNSGFPKDLVARIFLSEIHAFSAKVSPQSLNEVTVIVHPSDTETVQSFVKRFRGEWKGAVMKGAHTVQQSPAKKTPPVRSPQSAGFFGTVSTPSLGVHKMQIGHLMLEVSSGDITRESCDAIINSSNQAFSLKSGVSKAILDAAGVEVERECAQIVASQSQQSEMIMTSGGQLPCRNIIHVLGRNNPADIKHVVYSVLKHCEEKRFSSVAFPALGTGQGGAPPSAVADAMIDAVIDFVKKKKGTNLQNVKFLIFQTTMLSDFHESMLKRQQKSVEEEGGIMGWLKDTFGNMSKFFSGGKAEASANEDFVLVGEEFEPVVFQLCGETEEDLNEARKLITSFIVKEHMSSKIQDSAINYFSQEEAEVLSKLQRELTVSIKLSKSGPEPVLTMEGLTRDVAQAESQIRDMIRKVEKNLMRHREAFMLSSQVEWQYQDRSNNFVPFDILTNYDLEQAFKLQQPRVMIKINNDPYEAHLPSGTAKGNNGQIELKRTDPRQQTTVSLPSHWEDMKGKLVLHVKLQQGSQEYAHVEKKFRKTGLASNILQIERVQNETLWKNYMNQKAYLDKKNNHTNNEKLLFHGTGSDNIDKINERGFNRSYAGMHGAVYGNGVYFAVDPSYSAQGYAKPDLQGHKRMYLARVLVGDFTTGKAGLLAPPAKNSTGTEQYDSVTDSRQSMFVIFHDIHAYPEYLITFQ